jgi:hypothetical protein
VQEASQRSFLLSYPSLDSSSGSISRHYLVGGAIPPSAAANNSGIHAASAPGSDPAALVQQQLAHLDDWDRFDVLEVERNSPGHVLQHVAFETLCCFNMLGTLGLPEAQLRNFLAAAERHYLPQPYHNSLHAADVTQALGLMLKADSLHKQLTPVETLALLFAAIIHDLGHPGTLLYACGMQSLI